MRLVSAARKAGLSLTLEQVFAMPDLSRLAAVLPQDSTISDTDGMVDITRAQTTAVDMTHCLAIPDHCRGLVDQVAPAAGIQTLMMLIGLDKWPEDNLSFEFSPALDIQTLRQAVESVVWQHEILRTVLVAHGAEVHQVVLKDCACDWEQTAMLPKFDFHEDDGKCTSLRLRIHHAFYDRVSLNLILRDIDAAYNGLPLSEGPRFDEWAAYVAGLDTSSSRQYWRKTLLGSPSMTYVGCPFRTRENVRRVQASVSMC